MNKHALLLATGALAACQPMGDDIRLALGDAQSYAEWLEETGQAVDPLPFSADPLKVSAVGEVRAEPDVAVITALISAEDPNESRALDAVGEQVNAVQAALADYDAQAGFTAIGSSVKRDETCLNHNREARRRHQLIQQDYWFNKRLDDRGDTDTERRPARPRIAQKVCAADEIRVFTRVSFRVSPAQNAGNMLRALADAGAEDARLAGYDFSDYDALYQQAAAQAVDLARAKAEAVASGAGGTLGELVGMDVDRPQRVRRFGPQPRIIRPRRPGTGDGIPALASHDAQRRAAETQRGLQLEPGTRDSIDRTREIVEQSDEMLMSSGTSWYRPQRSEWRQVGDGFERVTQTVVVQEAPEEYVSAPAPYETVTESFAAQEASSEWVTGPDGRMVERFIPTVMKTQTRRVPVQGFPQGNTQSNALTMSLMSGPQVIRVGARLSYDYATPLDGKIIVEDETT